MKTKNKELIAIVDSDPLVSEAVEKILDIIECESELFADTEDFLDNISDRFSLVILEIYMPTISGLNAIPLIKGKAPEIAIVMLTGQTGLDVALKCIRQGANDYFTKPIEDLDEFLNCISGVLADRRKRIDDKIYYQDLAARVKKFDDYENSSLIRREITFPPGYHQAGLSILNYFSKIVNQKYPHMPVKINIEQDGENVLMTVTSPDGNVEIIEKTLQEYSLVLSNKMAPEDFLPEPQHIMELRHKLDMAKMEASHTLQLMESERMQNKCRIESLERQVENLNSIVATGLEASNTFQNIILKFIESNKEVTSVTLELQSLKELATKAFRKSDEDEVKELLLSIKTKEPSLFDELYNILLRGAVSSVAGSHLASWIVAVSNALPR